MATYRCRSCGGVYVDVTPDGYKYFHTCPDARVDEAGNVVPISPRRDENIVQDMATGQVRIKAVGLGRALVSRDDLITGATPEEIEGVRHRPAIDPGPCPEEDHPVPQVWVAGVSKR